MNLQGSTTPMPVTPKKSGGGFFKYLLSFALICGISYVSIKLSKKYKLGFFKEDDKKNFLKRL